METNLKRTFLSAILAAILIAAVAGPAAAHHSFSAFNTTEQKTVTGTVKKVEWTNPHIWIYIEVVNDKGHADIYSFEGMSPNFLERRDWTRTTLKVGDKITVTFNPLRNGDNGGMFVNGKMTSGKVLTMGGGQ
jgi:Family of unknown function (DUF6152)